MFHCNVDLIREAACLCTEKIVYLHVHVPQIKFRAVSEATKDHKLLAPRPLSWLSIKLMILAYILEDRQEDINVDVSSSTMKSLKNS